MIQGIEAVLTELEAERRKTCISVGMLYIAILSRPKDVQFQVFCIFPASIRVAPPIYLNPT
ncbi:hypothetical protein VK70_09280 [Paenibacillus durus ATCC 35681]|uniref:Uncharacterized protein n=1 Tax=Paenibacillus durus ATCC 35681 TaxID=1333534 RepID=A0A0F7CIL6_PAEDU|nr:hypothetical protein VK70_09280 [Paenibacillus durus ATCC 35681]